MADTGTATTAAAGGIDGHAVAGRRGLTIREITLTPIVVPLDGVYRGSYYRMENRASIITRVVTEEGIVGEAYCADEDKTLADILHVIREEIAPRLKSAAAEISHALYPLEAEARTAPTSRA